MHDVIMITGHQPWAKGAANMNGPGPDDDIYEYDLNDPDIADAVARLSKNGIDAVHEHYKRGRYNTRYWSGKSRLLVECHCNAYDTTATGTEVLYARGSSGGFQAARIMQQRLVAELGLRSRGAKPLVRADRGGYLLWGVAQVALITEPGFIDNDRDLARMQERDLAGAYTDAIVQILKEMK